MYALKNALKKPECAPGLGYVKKAKGADECEPKHDGLQSYNPLQQDMWGCFRCRPGRWERNRCRIRRFSALYTWRASDVGCIPDTASSYNNNGKSTPFFSCFTISDTCTRADHTLGHAVRAGEVRRPRRRGLQLYLERLQKETHGMSLNTRRDVGKKNIHEYPMPTRPSCARR